MGWWKRRADRDRSGADDLIKAFLRDHPAALRLLALESYC